MGTFPSITSSAKCHKATSQEPVHCPRCLMEKETRLMKTRGLPSGGKTATKDTRRLTLKHCENISLCATEGRKGRGRLERNADGSGKGKSRSISPGGGHDSPLQYSCLENPHGQRSLAGYIQFMRSQ